MRARLFIDTLAYKHGLYVNSKHGFFKTLIIPTADVASESLSRLSLGSYRHGLFRTIRDACTMYNDW